MGFIRRSLKAYIVAICLFVLLTLVLAALLRFTSFDEDWTQAGLAAALSVVTLLLGILEGNIAGKRGLLVGIVSAAVFLIIVFLAVGGIFTGSAEGLGLRASYLIPLISGAVGGVLGTNSRKS